MLTSDQFDSFVNPVVDLYERYTESVINDIARRLAKNLGNVTDTAAWQMQRLTESGLVYEDALRQLAAITGESEATLRKSFTDAGVTALRYDDAIYRKARLQPLPLNLSPAMAEVLAATLRKTKGVIQNLTMTTAMSAQQAFINAADLAFMQVSTGAMSYDQAIRAAVKGVANDGLTVIDYATGHRDQLDVAMRRTVLTGVSQTANNLQWQRADEMGSDLVEVSAHAGARPSHAEWQGKIYSRSGQSTKYKPFVESTGYGTGAGLGGWNCRHSFYPFFEGLSEPAYSKADVAAMNDKTVPLHGEKVPMYDATQMQRAIERKIRYFKRQVGALDAAGLDYSVEASKVRQYQAEMRDFVARTRLVRQRVREQI
jgi:hypothetical protein